MPTMTLNSMKHERVAELIEAYGSNTQRWPEQERAAAIACLQSSDTLQQLQREAEQLDQALQAGQVNEGVDEALLARIVDQLPAQPATEVSTPRRHYQWPAAMAAAISAVAIMLVVINDPAPQSQAEQLALHDIDYWFWQEVTGQESFDDEEEPQEDFFSII